MPHPTDRRAQVFAWDASSDFRKVYSTSRHETVALDEHPTCRQTQVVQLRASSIVSNTAFMLVDRSDSAEWGHPYTGRVALDWLSVDCDVESTFVGQLSIGFVDKIDTNGGKFHVIKTIYLLKGARTGVVHEEHSMLQGKKYSS